MGKLTLLLLALLVWLQYSLWFGKNGIHDYSRVNDDVAAQQASYVAVAPRLPGHGTAPGALTAVDWETWLAATRLAVREATRLAVSR